MKRVLTGNEPIHTTRLTAGPYPSLPAPLPHRDMYRGWEGEGKEGGGRRPVPVCFFIMGERKVSVSNALDAGSGEVTSGNKKEERERK